MDSLLFRLWRRLQSLAKLFRFVELFTLIVLLSWISTRLPFAVRISGEYCRKTAALLFSPASIFLLGNAIVVTLLAKSGLFSGDASSSAVDNAVAELCRKLRSDDADDGDDVSETSPFLARDEVVFQDKEVIVCEEKIPLINNNNNDINAVDDVKKIDEVLPEEKRKEASYRRSKSENFKIVDSSKEKEKEKEKLRRSETDICRGQRSKDAAMTAAAVAEEEVDGGEEFRRTIEAFIAKQVRFHREESLAVVLHGQA